jgi:glutamyl-tRNA synthetase
VEGSVENIFETLKWVGIVPDESIVNGGDYGPYIQS